MIDIGVYVLVVRTICYWLVVICFVHEVVATMMPRRRFHKLTHMGGQAVVPVEMTHISMSGIYLVVVIKYYMRPFTIDPMMATWVSWGSLLRHN